VFVSWAFLLSQIIEFIIILAYSAGEFKPPAARAGCPARPFIAVRQRIRRPLIDKPSGHRLA